MPRKGYMTITVYDTTKSMFDEFCKLKNIKKTEALDGMLELYMMATDADLYNALSRGKGQPRDVPDVPGSFLFMNMHDADENFMAPYIRESSENGYAWFSVDSLFFGMNHGRAAKINSDSANGNEITILFSSGNKRDGNEIKYSAKVMRVETSKLPVRCPDESYESDKLSRMWLKLHDIKPESEIKLVHLKVISTGKNLRQIVSDAQYNFGYVGYS